ncbi:MAG TPA: lipase secretion chaperone [Burkholderiaceae bacterium]|nr:lipase secretion chaperone [Burkholderiaceae bacterium]
MPHACAGAAVLAVLLYAAWPAAAPERTAVVDHDNYFAFVKATPVAAAARAPAAAAAAGTQRDAAANNAADLPASPTALAHMEAEVQTLRQQGADEQAVYRLRAHRVNAQMAAQLAEREQAETAWQRRVQAYRAERDLLATSSRDGSGDATGNADVQAAQVRLRAQRFTPDEQARLDASLPPAQPQLRLD